MHHYALFEGKIDIEQHFLRGIDRSSEFENIRHIDGGSHEHMAVIPNGNRYVKSFESCSTLGQLLILERSSVVAAR